MRFIATADTDVGISKDTNQDSLLIKHAFYDAGEVLFAVVCDGMGGHVGGKQASSIAVKSINIYDRQSRQQFKNDLKMCLKTI